MIHLFPSARATLKADPYFLNYQDSEGRFRVFDENEAPGTETNFITIEQAPADQDQLSGWATTSLTFNVIGKDTEKPTLWEIADKIRDIFQAAEIFAAVGTADAIEYQVLGDAVFDVGTNPVTENVYVSVALTFGIVP